MDRPLTPQQELIKYNEEVKQIEATMATKQKAVKLAQSAIEKLKAQLETKELQREILLRSNNLCFTCHKSMSSDEVKFCIDKSLAPLCQTCQRKQVSPEALKPSET